MCDPGIQVIKKCRNSIPVFLIHVAADVDRDPGLGHEAHRLHHLMIMILITPVVLAVYVIRLRSVHGNLDVIQMPVTGHFVDDLRGDEGAVGDHGTFIFQPGLPHAFADAVNSTHTQQRFPAEPGKLHLITDMCAEDITDGLLDDLQRHGDLLHPFLVAVDAAGVAAEGRQDGISPHALLFVVDPHKRGDLIVIGTLVFPFRNKEL